MFCLCWSKPPRTPFWPSPPLLSKRHSFFCPSAKRLSSCSHSLCPQESDEAVFSFKAWEHLPGRNALLYVLHACPLSTLAVISCCCQSSGTPIPNLWVCCDLRGFESPISWARQLAWKKNNSSSFTTFATRKRGKTWVTQWKWGQDRQNEAVASKNQQSLLEVTFAKCSQLHVGNLTCSPWLCRVCAGRCDAVKQPVTSVVFGKVLNHGLTCCHVPHPHTILALKMTAREPQA